MSDQLLKEVKDLVAKGKEQPKKKTPKRAYTKEDDIQLLEAFKPFAEEWGAKDTEGKESIAAELSSKVNRTQKSIKYRLERKLLCTNSLNNIRYVEPKKKKGNNSEEKDD